MGDAATAVSVPSKFNSQPKLMISPADSIKTNPNGVICFCFMWNITNLHILFFIITLIDSSIV